MLRFHLDEHVSPALAVALRQRGVDVTTTAEVGLGGADDPQHIAFARSQGRVIVTHDDDFLVLHSRGVAHAGIAYCHQGSRSLGEMLRALLLISECFSSQEMENRLEFL